MHLRRELIVVASRHLVQVPAPGSTGRQPDPSTPQAVFASRLRRDEDQVQQLVREWLEALATLPAQDPPSEPGESVDVGIIEMNLWTEVHNLAVAHLESKGWTIKKAAIMSKSSRSGVRRRRKGWRVTFTWAIPEQKPMQAAWPYSTGR